MFFNKVISPSLNKALAIAAAALGLISPYDLQAPQRAKRFKKSSHGRSWRTKSGNDIIADRSSSIRKLQRQEALWQGDERARSRHAWYRNQKAKEARLAAQNL